jgi:membrane protein DedA with SNARE-associated domain
VDGALAARRIGRRRQAQRTGDPFFFLAEDSSSLPKTPPPISMRLPHARGMSRRERRLSGSQATGGGTKEPMHASISGMLAEAIVTILSAAGYAGLAGLMAIESACVPLPSEVILPFAGYLVSRGQMNLYLVATIGALGCNLGSAVAYAVGRYGGRHAIERWGRYVLLTREDLRRADWFFDRFGNPAVLIARMLPVVRTFIALPAGISRMALPRFHLYTFVGSWPWCFLLAYIGMLLGDKWGSDPRMSRFFRDFDYAVAAFVVIALGRFAWKRWSRRGDRKIG